MTTALDNSLAVPRHPASPGRLAPLACTVVESAEGASGLREEWTALLDRSTARNNGLALRPEWLLNWWRVFGPLGGRQLRLALFRRGDRLIGLAPLLSRRRWHVPGIPFRRLELLGTGEPAEDAVCSDYLNVLAERGAEAEVAATLARALADNALGRWDEIVLAMMDGDDPMPALLRDAFAAAGFRAELRQTTEAPYIPLPATWDEYLKRLSKKSRYLVRHSLCAFTDWAGAAWRLERAADAEGLATGKAVLAALHRERWDGTGGGTFRSPRFLSFHAEAMAGLLREGGLELLWLTVGGEPVAAMYSHVWNGKVYFYQCGRKLDVPPQVRPGGALLALAIRGAIEAGRREFDFLGGTATYKSQLALASRPLVELRAVRPCWRERLRLLAERGRGTVRWLKRAWKGLRGKSERTAASKQGS